MKSVGFTSSSNVDSSIAIYCYSSIAIYCYAEITPCGKCSFELFHEHDVCEKTETSATAEHRWKLNDFQKLLRNWKSATAAPMYQPFNAFQKINRETDEPAKADIITLAFRLEQHISLE